MPVKVEWTGVSRLLGEWHMAKNLEEIELAFRQKYSSAETVDNGQDHLAKPQSAQGRSRHNRPAGTTIAFYTVLIVIIIVIILLLMEENRKRGNLIIAEDIGINALAEPTPAVTLALAPGPTLAPRPALTE